MSEMVLEAAVRFKVYENVSMAQAHARCVSLFKKEPDYIDEWKGDIQNFEYHSDQNDGFEVHMPGNALYIDYMLSSDKEVFDLDLNITQDQINEIAVKFYDKFGFVTDWKIKVLYFYNGGCAGISEVE